MPRDDDPFTDLRDEHTNEVQVDSIVGTPDAAPDPLPSEVEVAFQPQELVGSYPVSVTGARLEGDRVRVDLVLQWMRGGTRPLSILLVNRPPNVTPLTGTTVSSMPAKTRPVADPSLHATVPSPRRAPRDLPAVWYGLVGVAGGVSIGLLTAYLLGWVLP